MICLYFIIYQIGIHPFCIAVIDSNGVSSGVSCLALAVGGANPSTLLPSVVQGSATPVGTVMATHTRFSIRGRVFPTYDYPSGSPFIRCSKYAIKANDQKRGIYQNLYYFGYFRPFNRYKNVWRCIFLKYNIGILCKKSNMGVRSDI